MQKISILVPVYNEERTLATLLTRLISQKFEGYEREIIVVDDGSRDGTPEILSHFPGQLQIVTHPHNRGRGAAIQTGIRSATGSVLVFQDADLEYDPTDLPKLVAALEGDTVAVYGSRNIASVNHGYPHYVLGVKILTGLVNLLFSAHLTDIYTGYKVLPVGIARALALQSDGFELEPEITVKLLKRGVTIKELPISYHPRTFKEGKKITFIDGVKGLWAILRYYCSRA